VIGEAFGAGKNCSAEHFDLRSWFARVLPSCPPPVLVAAAHQSIAAFLGGPRPTCRVHGTPVFAAQYPMSRHSSALSAEPCQPIASTKMGFRAWKRFEGVDSGEGDRPKPVPRACSFARISSISFVPPPPDHIIAPRPFPPTMLLPPPLA